jgi:AcrR family transcriptional regulator
VTRDDYVPGRVAVSELRPAPPARTETAARGDAGDDASHDLAYDAGDGARDPVQDAGRDPGQDAARDPRQDAARDPGGDSAREPGQDAARQGGHDPHHDARRGDTRARIQQVALELFAEQGYEKTSLREIAERLDVTKAALYYHFKSKEEIVRSLAEEYFGQMDALITWAKGQPRTPATRGTVLRRYVEIVADGSDVFRMLHHNQAAVNSLASAKERGGMFRERMTGLVEALTEPGAGVEDRLRATMALGGVSVGWMFFADQVTDRTELCAAVLSIASDLARADSEASPGA